VAGAYGHLANSAAASLAQSLLAAGTLRQVMAAHLSEQNNRPDLARQALLDAMGNCVEIHVADGRSGSAWLSA
jgi:phosphoribosyl 1,2-cyclic phosphodiesterase